MLPAAALSIALLAGCGAELKTPLPAMGLHPEILAAKKPNSGRSSNQSFIAATPLPAVQVLLALTWRSNFAAKKSAAAVIVNPVPSPSASKSDFYVSASGNDANSGTLARPWKTINRAALQIKAGDVVHVAPGEYRGNVKTSVNGNAGARIRFISDKQGAARIVGGSGEAAWQNKGNYVDVMGFDVTGGNANGIENLASNVRILGNTVHDILALCSPNGGSGIINAEYTTHDNDIGFNFVHDIRAPARCNKRHGVGIYQTNLRGHVYNNVSIHNGSVGIQLWHAANAVVVANNMTLNNAGPGIVIGAGDSPGGIINDHSIVINNISIHNGQEGIQEFGATGPDNRFQNNISFGNGAANMETITGTASGTIIADPQFVNNTGNWDGDYHLSPKSPAIDAGVSANSPTTDMVGGRRPQGRAVDIGAYEFGARPGKWPWQ